MSESEGSGDAPIVFFLVALFAGVFFMTVINLIPRGPWRCQWVPPYSVLLFVVGMAMSRFSSSMGELGHTVEQVKLAHPHIILFYLLPPLLYESASTVDFHMFMRVSPQAMLLAVPGVMFSIACVGFLLKLAFTRYAFSWGEALLGASILCATDPVAVVAALHSLGAPRKLAYLVEGESLLNDGSAFVFFLIFQELAGGASFSFSHVVAKFLQLSVGGPLWGYACAIVLEFWLGWMHGSGVHEITTLMLGVYACFYLAEAYLSVSGVLAVVCMGLYMSLQGNYALSTNVLGYAHSVVEVISFLANTVLFILAGVLVENKLISSKTGFITFTDYLFLLLLYIFLHVVRAITIGLMRLFPGKESYSRDECVLLICGGLRGAVGIALALMVELDTNIREDARGRIIFFVAGIVAMTITINGAAIEFFYKERKNPFRNAMLHELTSRLDKLQEKRLHSKLRRPDVDLAYMFTHVQWDIVEKIAPPLSKVAFQESPMRVPRESRSIRRIFKEARPVPKNSATSPNRQKRRTKKANWSHWMTMDVLIHDLKLDEATAACLRAFKLEQLSGISEEQLKNHVGIQEIGARKRIHLKMKQIDSVDVRAHVFESFFNAVDACYERHHKKNDITGRAVVVLVNAAGIGRDVLSQGIHSYDFDGEGECHPVEKEWAHLERIITSRNHHELRKIPLLGSVARMAVYDANRIAIEALAGYIGAHERAIRELGEPFLTDRVTDLIIEAEKKIYSLCVANYSMAVSIITLYGARAAIHVQLSLLAQCKNDGDLSHKDYHQFKEMLERRLTQVSKQHHLSEEHWSVELLEQYTEPHRVYQQDSDDGESYSEEESTSLT